MCILKKSQALSTYLVLIVMVGMTVNPYHEVDGLLFSAQSWLCTHAICVFLVRLHNPVTENWSYPSVEIPPDHIGYTAGYSKTGSGRL